jgi:hypothetical protein
MVNAAPGILAIFQNVDRTLRLGAMRRD